MNRVDPLREGSGESFTSQGIRRPAHSEVPNGFSKKIHPNQCLGHTSVAFSLQKMKAHVEAHGAYVVGVVNVKLFIFKS
jgi:hypothetical protein